MNQQLQDAIKELAVYDGWVWEGDHVRPKTDGATWLVNEKRVFEILNYHISADALLPVYNKLSKLMTNEDLYPNWIEAGDCILKMNLPEAVIKLAGIIQQIKNK